MFSKLQVLPIILPVGRDSNKSNSGYGLGRNIVSKARRTEKTVEIHEFYVVRTASGSLPPICADCSTGDALMVAPEQAAVLAKVPIRVIYRWVETGSVHFREDPNGSLFVCLKSLPPTGIQILGA